MGGAGYWKTEVGNKIPSKISKGPRRLVSSKPIAAIITSSSSINFVFLNQTSPEDFSIKQEFTIGETLRCDGWSSYP